MLLQTSKWEIWYLYLPLTSTKSKDVKSSMTQLQALHGGNAVEVELSEELSNKHLTFPVSLIKPYEYGDSNKFPLRNEAPQNTPPVQSSGSKRITEAFKERKLRTKKVGEYLFRYCDPTCEDEWLEEKRHI
ncbi:hypothetical protein O181_116996 [Austropuccinia psidii MF-1]|uniref:Uncharacterized protein n=1 Tax=Austropuccinia psidii MF-1 TaxID=1389203 RepID=A0A9Q3PXJ9_9BASI|nr:hypothetical protein [Austropuccinia psidii MF-1]